jgi:protein-glutamine gamma-glutamyltransferase
VNSSLRPQPENYFAQRVTAIAIVFVQSFTFSMLMSSYVFPVCVVILASLALLAPRKSWLISLPGDRWVLVLGVLFFLKFYFAPRQLPFDTQFIFSNFSYEVASFCLVLELLFLYRKENKEKIPINFLASAVIGLVFSANIRLNQSQRITMLFAVQVFLVCCMIFSMKSRREVAAIRPTSNLWRNSVMFFVLVVAATLGTTASVQLHRHERALERMLSVYLEIGDRGPARSGFSNRGGLSDVSSWREFEGETLSLRMESDLIPGYLRGKAFDEFEADRWTLTRPQQRLPFVSNNSHLQKLAETLEESGKLYLLANEFPDQYRQLKIWPVDNETAGHCFAPLESAAMISRSHPLAIDPSKIITRPSEQKIVPYTFLATQSARQGESEILPDFLKLPELDERVINTAKGIYREGQSPREKMKATEQFFRTHFLYRKGIWIPEDEDRLGYFLENHEAAHCEYFATASTILLRLGGIPARYVTGFYVQEQNVIDKSWVARRKDAHAWVEAYDSESEKWVIVESTPSEGLPALTSVDRWKQRREVAAHFFRRIQEDMSRGKYVRAIWTLLQPALWLLTLIVVVLGVIWALKRKLPAKMKSEISYKEFHQELVSEREEMDTLLSQHGIERDLYETTSQFAERIIQQKQFNQASQCSSWYEAYSTCRFRPGYSEQQVKALRTKREIIEKQLKQQPQGVTSNV